MVNIVPFVKKLDFNASFSCDNILIESLGLTQSVIDLKIGTFVDSVKFLSSLKDNMSCIFVNQEVFDYANTLAKNPLSDRNVIISKNPRILFFSLHNLLAEDINTNYSRESFDTIIGNNTNISSLAYISKKNVVIGDNVIIEPFVMIYENTVIGNNCIIRTGTVLGSTGFEHKRLNDSIMSVNHIGGVIINDNVDINPNCVIAKAIYPWDNTSIGNYSKLDAFVHIAHGAKIGNCTLIAPNANILGRAVIGNNVWIGPSCTISNNIKIKDNSRVNIGSIVASSVREGDSVSGYYAINHEKFMIKQAQLFLSK